MGKVGRKKTTITGLRKARLREQSTALQETGSPQDVLTKSLPVFLVLAFLATLIYSNTFSAPFVFDDIRNIVENPRIKALRNFLDFSGSRYIGFLSFALNYHFGMLDLFDYHLVNLSIHIANGFLVYLLILLLFRTPKIVSSDLTINARRMAFATALLFISHPIQTQAVTYIVQRFASLAALFYLLAVVCYLKWRQAESTGQSFTLTGIGWYGLTLLSTVLAMKTKEISFTLPIMLVLIEVVFFQRRERSRWLPLIPFLFSLLIIPFSRLDVVGGAEEGFAKETTVISRSEYLFTQFRVIVTYLRLLFLPIHQNLDYDYPIYSSFSEPSVLLSFLFLCTLFGLSIYLVFSSRASSRLMGFGMLWFFLTLSIESSIIPIRDVIFEHRLYLPSVGFFVSCLIGISRVGQYLVPIKGRPGSFSRSSDWVFLFLLAVMIFSFSLATYQRNQIWTDRIALWEDVVKKSPNNIRAHNNLGLQYRAAGRLEDAMRQYQIILDSDPDYAVGHNNLAAVLEEQAKVDEAIIHYNLALQFKPNYLKPHMSLGLILGKQGRIDEAIPHFLEVLRINPSDALAHNQLAVALAKQGRFDESVPHFSRAIEIDPTLAIAHNHLGLAYYKLGRYDEAEREFKTALQIDSQYSEAHRNLEATDRIREVSEGKH